MTKEMIRETLKNMEAAEIVRIHNEYCDLMNNPDAIIYSMEEFDEIAGFMKPWELARACHFGGFNPTDEWFYFDGYGNLASADDWNILDPVYLQDIADYIYYSEATFNNTEIAELFEDDAA